MSGKVNYVFYQYKKHDQFAHKYEYDADNRLTDVFTSTDRFIWNREATYHYYKHGPLARVELGAYRSQGLDYYYTLQGWIKGVNQPYADSLMNGYDYNVGKDVFAYALGYYEGDYKAIKGTFTPTDSRDHLWTRLGENMNHNGLFNGNISWMVTDLAKIGEVNNDRSKGMQAMLYKYDQLHRITNSRSLTNYSEQNGFASRMPGASPYDETYTYDGNGNILTLDRMNAQGQVMHDYDYYYYKGTNKLRGVLPILRDTTYSAAINSNNKLYRDILVQGTARPQIGTPAELRATRDITFNNNFEAEEGNDFAAYIPEDGPFIYDAIGNLIADEEEGSKISWTPYGKVREVKTKNDSVVVKFRYDASGNRIEKRVEKYDTVMVTRYMRDASGNVMAIYKDTTVLEQPIYGSSRLGMKLQEVREGTQSLGTRSYELTNHLGNVLTTVSDNINMQADSAWTNVVSTNDYYPFGLDMEDRSWKDTTMLQSRYGFNGKEKDDNGELGNTTYDYGFRIYNPSIGKFLSVDPLTKGYPMLTPYQFASNRPIDGIDLDGLEYQNYRATQIVKNQGVSALRVITANDGSGSFVKANYNVRLHSTQDAFRKLKDAYTTDPAIIHNPNNDWAQYTSLKKSNTIQPNDHMKIEISALLGIKMDIYVRFTDVVVTENSFSITAATLYGHTDAGFINFSGSFDPESGMTSFSIYNETTLNVGSDLIGFGRIAQKSQWKTVLNNAEEYVGGTTESKTLNQEISIKDPQKGDGIKVASEDLLTDSTSESYIEKK